MGTFNIIHLNQQPQELEADGFYQKDNHIEFYKDSVAGEEKVLSLHAANVSHIQNLAEKAKAISLEKYKISYHSGQEEEIQFDGYRENGDWFDLYRDTAVGEKIIQSIKRKIVQCIEKVDS